ncbi:MAG: molybdopterin-dependent oxidoreductase [Coriobacteriia bacterium]
MVKKIVQEVDQGGENEVRPDFFREPPVKYTGGDLPWQWEEDGMIVTRSAAWSAPGCHDGCGVLIYTDMDGKFIKVEGDEANPFYNGRLCARCLALPEVIHHPDRLLYPMKRDRKDRGKDKWERISWDEAYDTIFETFNRIKAESGAKSIVFSLGTGRGTAPYMTRLQYAFGSVQYAYFLSGNSCYVPRVAACMTLMGAYAVPDCSQYFIDRYDHEGWVPPKNIFVWGNNPLIANADGNMGHWIVDCMKRGSKLIVVDPCLTWLAARADLWLQIRPGTDAALAMAMGNIIINEDIYDHEFVDNWCYGFEQYAEAVSPYTAEKASEITWIPAEKIVAAARLMAEKPTSIQWGLALDMTLEAISGSASVVDLWSITGQVDIPGGMITTHQPFNIQTWNPPDPAEHLSLEEQETRIGGKEFPMLKYSGVVLTQADMTIDQMLTGRPYKIRANWIQSTNPLSCTAQEPESRMEPAYSNAEFNVCVDLFMTPTAMACCDMVLPVATYPERDGIRGIYYFVQNTNKAAKPLGEVKSDMELGWELGRRWSPKAWPGDTLLEFFTFTMKETGMTFEETREENWIYPEYHYEKFRTGEQRPDGGLGFNTPTGRIELYSTLLQSWGQSPLPFYEEPPFGPYTTPEMMEKYPFILTTGARQWASFHSEHRQIPHLRALHPEPEFKIHPEPAAKLGIKSGDWCYLYNDLGKIKMVANVTPAIGPRVVSCDHAWWFPERNPEDLYDTYESNANVLIQAGCGKSGFGNNCKSTICGVSKVAEANS